MNSRLEMRRRHAQRVLCDTDLTKRPLLPRRYEDAASMVASAVLIAALVLALAWLGCAA